MTGTDLSLYGQETFHSLSSIVQCWDLCPFFLNLRSQKLFIPLPLTKDFTSSPNLYSQLQIVDFTNISDRTGREMARWVEIIVGCVLVVSYLIWHDVSGVASHGAWHLLAFLMGPFITFNCLSQLTIHSSTSPAFPVPGQALSDRDVLAFVVTGIRVWWYVLFKFLKCGSTSLWRYKCENSIEVWEKLSHLDIILTLWGTK